MSTRVQVDDDEGERDRQINAQTYKRVRTTSRLVLKRGDADLVPQKWEEKQIYETRRRSSEREMTSPHVVACHESHPVSEREEKTRRKKRQR